MINDMVLIVRDFLPEDVDRIILREGQEMAAATPERVKQNAGLGACITLERAEDKEIICCGGIVSFWPGVGEMWMVCGENMDRYKKTIVVESLRFLAARTAGFHRLHMAVRGDNERNLRFARAMGFHAEGTLEKFDEMKNDFVMMARIR